MMRGTRRLLNLGVSAAACIFLSANLARGNNAACWGYGKDDPDRPDISCTALTPQLFVRLAGATRQQVERAMNAPGRAIEGGLHFVSNHGRGAINDGGSVTFGFTGDRVSSFGALIDAGGGGEYLWSMGQPGCSDFPGSRKRCDH